MTLWQANSENDGMRYMEECDVSGGATDCTANAKDIPLVFIWSNGDFYTITRKQAAIDEIQSQPFY